MVFADQPTMTNGFAASQSNRELYTGRHNKLIQCVYTIDMIHAFKGDYVRPRLWNSIPSNETVITQIKIV